MALNLNLFGLSTVWFTASGFLRDFTPWIRRLSPLTRSFPAMMVECENVQGFLPSKERTEFLINLKKFL